MDFNTLDTTKAKAIINNAVFAWQAECRAFRRGDHWYDGRGWFGPGPAYGETGFSDISARLEARFISANEVGKGVDTKVSAVIGKSPKWGMVASEPMPEGEDDAAKAAVEAWHAKYDVPIAEADALLTRWWDARGIHTVLQELEDTYETEGRANLRLFVPRGQLDESGAVPAGNLEESLNCLYVEVPANDSARVYLDRDSMASVGIYFFKENEEFVEGGVTGTRLSDRCEITFVDGTGKTVLRVIGGKDDQEAAPLELSGNLWHFQVERTMPGTCEPARFITPQVIQAQKLLNFSLSAASNDLRVNGWLEEFLVNCELPGETVDVTDAETGKVSKRFIPDKIVRGPGMSRNLKSQIVETNDGTNQGTTKTTVLPADVKWRPPAELKNTLLASEVAERCIARGLHQEHLLNGGSDANSSGEFLKQKRAGFVSNCLQSAALINEAGRWLLETALLAAVAFSGEANPYADLRPTFECQIDGGPLSAAEQQELTGLVAAGLMSRETAMARAGIEDVDAEANRIESESKDNLDAQAKRVETNVAAGVPNEITWRDVLGYDDDAVLRAMEAEQAAMTRDFVNAGEGVAANTGGGL